MSNREDREITRDSEAIKAFLKYGISEIENYSALKKALESIKYSAFRCYEVQNFRFEGIGNREQGTEKNKNNCTS